MQEEGKEYFQAACMYEHRSESLGHSAGTVIGNLEQVAEGQEGSNTSHRTFQPHEEFSTGSWEEVLERLLNR